MTLQTMVLPRAVGELARWQCFIEHVTVHRSNSSGRNTVIEMKYFMAAPVMNCRVGSTSIFANETGTGMNDEDEAFLSGRCTDAPQFVGNSRLAHETRGLGKDLRTASRLISAGDIDSSAQSARRAVYPSTH